MDIIALTAGLTIAYLVGSIPTAVWVGKVFYDTDVRKHGSGNAGATNTFRTIGKKAGFAVLLFDIFKGWLATYMAAMLVDMQLLPADYLVFYKLLFGAIAVIGHIFPVYVGFKGGKGVATLLGMILGAYLPAALVCVAVFMLIFFSTHYVSLGSMLAALCFPLLLMLPTFYTGEPYSIGLGFLLFVIVVLTHKQNIARLKAGVENKTYLGSKKKTA